jgi:hypothetical protein
VIGTIDEMLRTISTIAGLIQMIFLPLNFISGFIAVIWVGIIGELSTAGLAALILVLAPFVLAWPMAISILIVIPAYFFLKLRGGLRFIGYILAFPFALLGGLWNWLVMTVWGIASFVMMFRYFQTDGQPDADLLPYSLLAYGLSTSPWFYMQSKEASAGGPEGAGNIHILFIQIAAAWSIYDMTFATQRNGMLLIWLTVMGIGFLISMCLGQFVAIFDKIINKSR